MKIKKRDGAHVDYDESKVLAAVMGAGVPKKAAAEISAEVTRTARRPLTVAKVGDLTEAAMMRAGLHKACRSYIEYRSQRRRERIERAGVTGGIDETLKHVRASTLRTLRDADPDIHAAISQIQPECGDLILSGRFIPDDIIIMDGKPSGPYHIMMPHGVADQLEVMKHASKYAIYVDWNRTPQTFRDAFRAVCAHTGCRIREGRFGGMLDMSRIPLTELADTAKRAAAVLEQWEGASGPGVMIPPGMNHSAIHDILYDAIPGLVPTAIYGKLDPVWGDTPYRGGCPECGGELVRTESCVSCQQCGWSACST